MVMISVNDADINDDNDTVSWIRIVCFSCQHAQVNPDKDC